MYKIKNILLLILIIFFSVACSKKEEEIKTVETKKTTKKKQIENNRTKKKQASEKLNHKATPLKKTEKKEPAEMEKVKKKIDELSDELKQAKSTKSEEQINADLLNIDWRDIENEEKRFNWAIQVINMPTGRQKALEALASLTNSNDTTLLCRSYIELARASIKDNNLLKVKKLLVNCERKLNINPNDRNNIKPTQEESFYLGEIWDIRATLSRELSKQKYKGKYNKNDFKSEVYWREL